MSLYSMFCYTLIPMNILTLLISSVLALSYTPIDLPYIDQDPDDRETNVDAALDKIVRPLFDVNMRVVYLPKSRSKQKAKWRKLKILLLKPIYLKILP